MQVMVVANKDVKEAKNNKIVSMSGSNDGILNRIFADVSKKSATQQILFGVGSGW